MRMADTHLPHGSRIQSIRNKSRLKQMIYSPSQKLWKPALVWVFFDNMTLMQRVIYGILAYQIASSLFQFGWWRMLTFIAHQRCNPLQRYSKNTPSNYYIKDNNYQSTVKRTFWKTVCRHPLGVSFEGVWHQNWSPVPLSHKLAHQTTLNNGRQHRLNIGYTLSPWSHFGHNWVTNTLTITPVRCESRQNNNEVVNAFIDLVVAYIFTEYWKQYNK